MCVGGPGGKKESAEQPLGLKHLTEFTMMSALFAFLFLNMEMIIQA